MANEAQYAYSNAGTLCGSCSHFMDGSESDHDQQPFVYIVICRNQRCPNYGIRFRLGEQAKITLERI